ncbi:Gfo/Idh/MocA family protein [Streptomyces barkulensis]|uniref:Gfo/Idh/MocA family protein n=1 Tax=Streptomyces barkulensis TaxID=1257026 RepID=UPI000C6E2A45|nr:Gfo/Idh/MocA family oxidoreductase [Streptomyces barkulensis]
MTEPVRIGVLGCADIARRRMLPAMAASPHVRPAAVAARDPRRAEETARPYGCRATGYLELLADPEIDAVYVPLPAALHARWVEAALRAGKHVLAEKPLTTGRDRTAALLSLARARGLALMENVMFVHHGQHRAVGELVRGGAIGELRSFRAEFTVPARPEGDIRHSPELGGGALWDTGVYPVRAALHFLGHELSVLGAHLETHPRHGVDVSGAALLRTPGGVTAQLLFGLDHGYRSCYELVGSRGRIRVDRAFTPGPDQAPAVLVERGTEREEPRLPPEDQVVRTLDAFAAAVRAGEVVAGPECLREAELLEAVRAAGSGVNQPVMSAPLTMMAANREVDR